jgi:hypothetical protein
MRGRERTVLGSTSRGAANIVERTLYRARFGSAQAEACALRSGHLTLGDLTDSRLALENQSVTGQGDPASFRHSRKNARVVAT